MKSSDSTRYIYAQSNSFDPYFNLALEKFLFDNVHDDEVIFYLWQNEKTVVAGRNQNIYKECNLTNLKALGGHAARRLSGGGCVFHDLGNLNFTFVAKDNLYDLEKQLRVIARACDSFGLKAIVSGRNDITISNRKFSGNAFYESHGRKLHHGTIMIDVDSLILGNVLNVNREKLVSKGVDSVASRTANLSEFNSSITPDKMKEALRTAFKEEYGFKIFSETLSLGGQSVLRDTGKGGWTSSGSMLNMLKSISENQKFFSGNDWLFGKKYDFSNIISDRFPWGEIEICTVVRGDTIREAKVFSDSLKPDFITAFEAGLKNTKYTYEGISEALDSVSSNHDPDISVICNDIKNLIKREI